MKPEKRKSVAEIQAGIEAIMQSKGYIKRCQFAGCTRTSAGDRFFRDGLCSAHQKSYDEEVDSELEELVNEAADEAAAELQLRGVW